MQDSFPISPKGWYFKGGGFIGNAVDQQTAWIEKYAEVYGLNDTVCEDCEEYSFKYSDDNTDNPCGKGCKTRLDQIVRNIEEKNMKMIKHLEKGIGEIINLKEKHINAVKNFLKNSEFRKPTTEQMNALGGFDKKLKEYKDQLKAFKFDKKIIALLCCDRNVKNQNGFSKWECPSGQPEMDRGPSYIHRRFFYYIRQVFGEFATKSGFFYQNEKDIKIIPKKYIEGEKIVKNASNDGILNY